MQEAVRCISKYQRHAGVIKVCLALEYGMMPANLHYHRDTPNPDSAGLRDGTLEVSFLKFSSLLYDHALCTSINRFAISMSLLHLVS